MGGVTLTQHSIAEQNHPLAHPPAYTMQGAHRHGDANNAILAAVGYNFRLLIRWLRFLLCLLLNMFRVEPKLAAA